MATTVAGEFAFRSGSGTVYRYGPTGALQIDVEKTLVAERLLRDIHAMPSLMTRLATCIVTFAAVFTMTTHVYRPLPAPSPIHSSLTSTIVAHNVATQTCLRDITTCGDAP